MESIVTTCDPLALDEFCVVIVELSDGRALKLIPAEGGLMQTSIEEPDGSMRFIGTLLFATIQVGASVCALDMGYRSDSFHKQKRLLGTAVSISLYE